MRLDRGGRRMQAARLLGVLRDDLVELRRIGADLLELVLAVLHALQRALRPPARLRANATAPATRSPSTISSTSPARERVLRRDRIARQDHRQRLLDADQARQALRAARAGDEAELDLGQAEPRAGRGDAEMAAQRQLEPAAERRAVHRRDGRLLHLVEHRDHVDQARRLRRLAELRDVGAGDERAPRAGEDDGFDARVVTRRDDVFHDALAHAMAQRIHGRIVDGDDGDVAVATQTDRVVQGASLDFHFL